MTAPSGYRCPGVGAGTGIPHRTVFHAQGCCDRFAELPPDEQARTGFPPAPDQSEPETEPT